ASAASTRLNSAMMSRLTASRSAGWAAPPRRDSIAWNSPRSAPSQGSPMGAADRAQGETLGRRQDPASVENDDGALGPGDDPGDVLRGEAAYHRSRRRDGRAVHPDDLPDLVHQHAHPLLAQIHHHKPGLLP